MPGRPIRFLWALPALLLIVLATPAAAQGILESLRDWGIAEQLRLSFYAYPIVNAVHILGLALLVAAIILVDLRILGLFRRTPFAFFGRILEPTAALGLLIAIVAGFFLFVVKPLDYAENAPFLVKIGIIAVAIVNAIVQRFSTGWRVAMNEGAIGARMRFQAALSLILWIAALFAGRFIAFLE